MLRRRSCPGGVSREQGGTIVADSKGRLSLQNMGGDGSTSGSFTPKLTLNDPAKYNVRGVFHTHPYDKSEGSYTGVSLSGGDAAYLINSGQSIIVAQSGAKQFAYVRTAKTPSAVDAAVLDKAQNDRIATLVGQGYSFPQASRQAAVETAKNYGLAYYEGRGGTLVRK
jgi:type VI secretion system secreted protein VgrG